MKVEAFLPHRDPFLFIDEVIEVSNEKIVFHGNNKSDKEIEFAVKNNIKVIVDNDHDLKRLDKISCSLNSQLDIMIRFTPGIECHTHE